MSPLCESFLTAEQIRRMEPFFPLHVFACERCYLVQLEAFVAAGRDLHRVRVLLGVLDRLGRARAAVRRDDQRAPRPRVPTTSSSSSPRTTAICSSTSSAPASRSSESTRPRTSPRRPRSAACRRSSTFFGRETAQRLVDEGKRASLIVGNNVLAQVPDLNDFVAGVQVLLRDDGTATFEFPHLLRLLDGLQYDTIYHEHFSYFSFATTAEIFRAHGLEVYDVEELWTHGGSLRVYAQHAGGPHADDRTPSPSCSRARSDEGLRSPERYARFAEDVKESKRALLELLIRLRREGKQVVGYGAPGKGNTLLNYCGIRTDLLDYTVDRNPYKHGLFTPGTHIPIFPPEKIAETKPDYVLVLPWNLIDEIAAQLDVRRGLGRPADRPRPVRNRPQRFEEGSFMKVVIFCGGFGVRMGEETQRIPKPMIQVGNRPILWHIMKWYASWGYDDFVLCLGYKAESIKEYFLNYNEALSNDFVLSNGGPRRASCSGATSPSWRITFVDTGTQSTIAERLLAVAPHLDGDEYFLATYGDGLTDAPLPDMIDRAPLVGQDRALPLRPPDLQRARRRRGRGRRRSLRRGHAGGRREDQRRLLRLPARRARLHQPGRGARRRAVQAADRAWGADRLPVRWLLGADGHDEGQAAARRARGERPGSVAAATASRVESHARPSAPLPAPGGTAFPSRPRARLALRRHRDRLRRDAACADAGRARRSR